VSLQALFYGLLRMAFTFGLFRSATSSSESESSSDDLLSFSVGVG